jgi:hypothetical protein
MTCTKELAEFIAARNRVQAALDAQADCLRRLKALDAPTPRPRTPTLIGVAPAASPVQSSNARRAFVAAALGQRPNGRY